MDIGLIMAAGASVVALIVCAARIRGLHGHRPSRYAVVVSTLIAVDLWLWDVALDGLWGRHSGLVGPLTLVNALVAFGVIHELTGFGLHGEVNIGQRATLYTSPDQDLRDRGYLDGERRRPQL